MRERDQESIVVCRAVSRYDRTHMLSHGDHLRNWWKISPDGGGWVGISSWTHTEFHYRRGYHSRYHWFRHVLHIGRKNDFMCKRKFESEENLRIRREYRTPVAKVKRVLREHFTTRIRSVGKLDIERSRSAHKNWCYSNVIIWRRMTRVFILNSVNIYVGKFILVWLLKLRKKNIIFRCSSCKKS